MPHSSGGGSHSGGSSGGSSHSSGGGSHSGSSYSGSDNYSRSSDRESSSGNGIFPKISGKHFPNARTFIYTRNGETHYIYTNEDITRKNLKKEEIGNIIRYIGAIIVVLGIFVFFANGVLEFQKPIENTNFYKIKIEDRAGVLNETDELVSALTAFKEKTGVTPAVITVNNKDWENYYDGLYYYAYELYVQNFDDETHWVIVYSEPETPDANFNDWFWEGVIGNDTGKAVSQSYINEFNTSFQRNLLASGADVTGALSDAISELTKNIKPVSYTGKVEFIALLLIGGAALLFGVAPVVFIIRASIKKINIANNCTDLREINTDELYFNKIESRYNEKAQFSVDCSYCGRTYTVLPDNNRCPQCGAVEYSWDLLRNNRNSDC